MCFIYALHFILRRIRIRGVKGVEEGSETWNGLPRTGITVHIRGIRGEGEKLVKSERGSGITTVNFLQSIHTVLRVINELPARFAIAFYSLTSFPTVYFFLLFPFPGICYFCYDLL